MTRALALALLLCWPGWAAAQSPGWEEILGAADSAWEAGQVADAEQLYAAAIKKAESFGESDMRLARSLTAFGVFRRSMAIVAKALGPDDPSTATSMAGLAAVYQARARFAEAEPLYRRTLVILEKSVGPEHERVGIPLNNLAEVYRARGRWEDAARLYPLAIVIVEKNFGPDHPTLAGLLENYAGVLRRARRDAEALEIAARARDIRARHAIQNPGR